ncbi:TetR/AcrR family transcriptional regulator [Curtobacterium sp. MCPF17_031]|uniref:TetR/AcrR family transcriptional regulator n=1 Tax=Curtobacterium sp. MCPF17_031 TaxID=2175653 RepID=UPI000DA7C381|nr:TetR/AcrR family transcriptional regulator [Curtobacterium sp. MCPF17_031]PZE38637.1 TetR/AcrR family transcriptional regulator [Curtobacterium sp. MCPF17_031]
MTNTSRTRTGDQLRDDLLAAATDLLSQRLAVTPPSLRETARACGVSATAVYRHFPSQQALLIAVATQSLTALTTAIEAAGAGASTDDDRAAALRTTASAYVTWAVANPGAYQLLFEGRDLLEDPVTIESGIDRLQSRLDALLVGLPAGDRDERLQADLLWISLHGLVVTRIRKTRQQWQRSVVEDATALVDTFIG